MTVAAILKQKGGDVARVAPTDTLAQVAGRLAERQIGAVLVMDRADQVMGILSERDIVRTMQVHGGRTPGMTAAQVMTRVRHTAAPQTRVDEAMRQMTENRVRHLPVLDGTRLVGIVSIGDVVKAVLDQQAQEVDSLRAYVTGTA